MLHARELADQIDLTNEAKTRIFNPDGVFGIHTWHSTHWGRIVRI